MTNARGEYEHRLVDNTPPTLPPPDDTPYLLARLEQVVEDLVISYGDYAVCWAVEKQARAAELKSCLAQGLTASATEAWAFVQSASAAAETVKVGQSLKALECERDYLMFLLSRPRT